MFAKKKKEPASRGQGAAAAKQMGLFMDPEDMMKGMDENLDDPDLEAELAALTGGKAAARGRAKAKGKAPLPMEDIARMADECMKDIEDDDDENVEDDEDLLAELQEVVGDEEEEEDEDSGQTTSVTTESSEAVTPEAPPALESAPVSSAAPGSVQHTLEERLSMYQTALKNAKAAGEASKVRRLERGLKSLQSMLTALKKGRSVNEADIPPPVATGAARPPPPAPTSPSEGTAPVEESEPMPPSAAVPEITVETSPEEEQPPSSESAASLSALPTPEEEKTSQEQPQDSKTNANDGTRTMLLERQREYKMAALRAKKEGDKEQAMQFFRISKGFDAVLEALGRGESVDLSSLPPSLGQGSGGTSAPVKGRPTRAAPPPPSAAPAAPSVPAPPKDALEALEQRKAKYVEASAQAKANGDDRKARMHDRIAKQYQNAIRAHKAGKAVNFDELPVPPGFPPIPGQKTPEADQGIVAALEAAHKLASADVNQTAEDDEGEEQEAESKPEEPKKPLLDLPAAPQKKRTPSPDRRSQKDALSPTSDQVETLENRRKQLLKAAVQAKQKNELDQAKALLRKAKALEPMIEAARAGKPMNISQIPSPPGDEDDDFIMIHHSDVQLSEKAEEIYAQLTKILQEQYEKCMTHSKQFTHLGNVKETTKFEKMAESCKKSLELLKLSHSRGLPPPKHHFEERAFHTVGIFPELSSTEMVVIIVKGINLPAPSGIQTNDLDAFIKFDFPYPSTEQAQKHKTSVIKNTNCPEYNQSFTLTINRNHRGFRRLVTSKGLKLELFHKGGFLRSDKPIGTAVVKLEGLENQSEIREIVEVMDGRKHTGGRVDVKVRLREPLSGTELQTSSLKWLVIDQV
ncbi:coiled-coil and C2 domain-containing protein 1B isoform X2 [Boleophthalmus pectinirostris]|uniref:coiled-coil and C2 domain-containing protein 1B isoform X2 n=1 Tax=Boleophthalmus pectinirostris TaxID=150288 RepID=UPI00242A3C40|nr:coiled-coil and C2 domain-containing protein 1B isoform X2 [Boleophthalmus pectinirostris]